MRIQNKFEWKNNNEFTIEGVNFVIDISSGKNRRPSDDEAFTLVKTKDFLNQYFKLKRRLPENPNILELGIFQGGSFVLLDKIFDPDSMSAVEIDSDPIKPLVKYCESIEDRKLKTYFGKSQGDADLLNKIVDEDFGGKLDLVIDDASHRYALTADSFHALFSKLQPGGYYVIEDWAWAHTPAHEAGKNHGWSDDPSLTRFVFELVTNLGLRNSIYSIEIYRELAVIKKTVAENGSLPLKDPAIRGVRLPETL